MNAILRTAWERWQIIGRINGEYVSRFITNFFYFTILVPFGLGVRFFADPLDLRKVAPSYWKERKPVNTALDDARSQY